MRWDLLFFGAGAVLTALGVKYADKPWIWDGTIYIGILFMAASIVDFFARKTKAPRERRMIALLGMIICGVGFVGFGIWYSWPVTKKPDLPVQVADRPILKARIEVDGPYENVIKKTDLSFYLINDGDRDIVIQEIALLQRFIQDKDYRGGDKYTSLCVDPSVPDLGFRKMMPEQYANGPLQMKDKSIVYIKNPTLFKLNGSPITGHSITVPAKKTETIFASFKVEHKLDEYNIYVFCPIIRLFDSDGTSVTVTCQGSIVGNLYMDGKPSGRATMPLPGTYVLLPRNMDAKCHFGGP